MPKVTLLSCRTLIWTRLSDSKIGFLSHWTMPSLSFLGFHYTLFHIPSIYIICNQHKIIKRSWKSRTSSFRSTSVYSQPKNRSLCMATLLNIILIVIKLFFDVAAIFAVFFFKKIFFQNINPVMAREKLRIGPHQMHLYLKSPVCNSHFILHSIGGVWQFSSRAQKNFHTPFL